MLDMRFAGLRRFLAGFAATGLPANTDDTPHSVPAAATGGAGGVRSGVNFTRHHRLVPANRPRLHPHLWLVP